MRIRCVQMDVGEDVDANIARAIQLAFGSPLQGVDVILFPELFTTGHQLRRLEKIAHRRHSTLFKQFAKLAKQCAINVVLGSVAFGDRAGVSNTCFVFNRSGRVAGQYSKIHLFKPMDEARYFVPGSSHAAFELDGIRMTTIICYDLRFPELTRKLYVGYQPEIVFVPMAWPAPRTEIFRTLMRARAIENQCFMVSANRVGTDGKASFEGYSMVADPLGRVVAELPHEQGVLDVDIDMNMVRDTRLLISPLADRREEVYAEI